jgi:NAD(P)-dependent dehydrogenase (short-subunit alcohol dehydrogenase family)/uncharacterized OB-fold protein
LTAAAAIGRFELQRCAGCGAIQYPPREACHRCLSLELEWTAQSGEGRLISDTLLLHSHDPYFRERLPWRVGLIRLNGGPTVVAHVHKAVPSPPADVRVSARLDKSGTAALVAIPAHEEVSMNDDRQMQEMSCDPRDRSVLVTDASTPIGMALIRELVAAGAGRIWAGVPPGRSFSALELGNPAHISVVQLDIRSAESISTLAETCAGQIDILINNARYDLSAKSPVADDLSGQGADADTTAREEMEVNYFGLLRLCQTFGPRMRARSGQGVTAWVNLLSLYSLSNMPVHATFSASMAAALSLSQGLRAVMRTAGIRVVNVFVGPITPEGLARSVVGGLREGVEDVYPGDVAQEWLARWLDSPKVLERELAEGI